MLSTLWDNMWDTTELDESLWFLFAPVFLYIFFTIACNILLPRKIKNALIARREKDLQIIRSTSSFRALGTVFSLFIAFTLFVMVEILRTEKLSTSNKSAVCGIVAFCIICISQFTILVIKETFRKKKLNDARPKWLKLHEKNCEACKNEEPCDEVNNPPNFDDPGSCKLGGAIHNEVMAKNSERSEEGLQAIRSSTSSSNVSSSNKPDKQNALQAVIGILFIWFIGYSILVVIDFFWEKKLTPNKSTVCGIVAFCTMGFIILLVLEIRKLNEARLKNWAHLHKKNCEACKNDQPCDVVNNPPNFDDPETYKLWKAIPKEVMANANNSVTGESVGREGPWRGKGFDKKGESEPNNTQNALTTVIGTFIIWFTGFSLLVISEILWEILWKKERSAPNKSAVFGIVVSCIIGLVGLVIKEILRKTKIHGPRLKNWVRLHKKHCKACKNDQPCGVVKKPPNFDLPETYAFGGAIHKEVMANAKYRSAAREIVGREGLSRRNRGEKESLIREQGE